MNPLIGRTCVIPATIGTPGAQVQGLIMDVTPRRRYFEERAGDCHRITDDGNGWDLLVFVEGGGLIEVKYS